jgi:Domain of unknown function (DUF1707)
MSIWADRAGGLKLDGVTGEMVPQQRDLRMSDADRERVVGWLRAAVSEGRLTLPEFEERVDGVLHAKTYGEVEPYTRDLPLVGGAVPAPPAPRDVVELRTVASSLKRRGRWTVPRRLVVRSKAGSVKLNFADAVIIHPVVEIELDVLAGSTELVLPDGATADLDDVEVYAGSTKSRVPASYDSPPGGTRFVVTGSNKAGSLKVRYQRRFWRWRW